MNLLSFIGDIFKPAAKLIDDVHTSTEEKMKLNAAIKTIENEMLVKVIDYETKLLESKSKIIMSESQGQSWMQRNWRPITMMTFLVLVVCDSFGLLAFRLADEAWTLLQIGLGGYVTGRSAEKIVDNYKKK